jgi:hypothetical protein
VLPLHTPSYPSTNLKTKFKGKFEVISDKTSRTEILFLRIKFSTKFNKTTNGIKNYKSAAYSRIKGFIFCSKLGLKQINKLQIFSFDTH